MSVVLKTVAIKRQKKHVVIFYNYAHNEDK